MKKAIVLGGTHDHIGLIEILKAKRYHVYLIDYLDNPPARIIADDYIQKSTLDIDAVSGIAKKINPDILITACIDQALLTMSHVNEKLKLPCHINYQTALELTNKEYMKSRFREYNIPTASYIVLQRFDAEGVTRLKFPLVVKPVDSNSSKGITKVKTNEDLEKATKIAFAHSRINKIIIEEFLEGEEFSVDVAVKNGVPEILMVTQNIKMKRNTNTFTITQSYFPATNDNMLIKKIHDIVKKIVFAYKIFNSPLLIQFINNDGELSVIEFSARLGGGSKHHLIKKITGFDALEWFVDLILSQDKEIRIQQKYKHASINYVYARNGKIAKFSGFDELVNDSIIEDYFFYKTKGMEITNHVASSDRPAGYLVADNDFRTFLKKLSIAENTIDIVNDTGTSMVVKQYDKHRERNINSTF